MDNEQTRLLALVKHWCPESLQHEAFVNQMLRALMHATACAADQHRALSGERPIRPLDSYPDPMVGYRDTPTGL